MITQTISSIVLMSGYSPWESGLQLAGLVLLCILIIVASYYVTKFVGGKQGQKYKNSNFKLLDACTVGNNKFLQIVKVGNRYFVIAVCKDNITKIAELTEEDIIFKRDEINATGFKDIFSSIINKKSQTDKEKNYENDDYNIDKDMDHENDDDYNSKG